MNLSTLSDVKGMYRKTRKVEHGELLKLSTSFALMGNKANEVERRKSLRGSGRSGRRGRGCRHQCTTINIVGDNDISGITGTAVEDNVHHQEDRARIYFEGQTVHF